MNIEQFEYCTKHLKDYRYFTRVSEEIASGPQVTISWPPGDCRAGGQFTVASPTGMDLLSAISEYAKNEARFAMNALAVYGVEVV